MDLEGAYNLGFLSGLLVGVFAALFRPLALFLFDLLLEVDRRVSRKLRALWAARKAVR